MRPPISLLLAPLLAACEPTPIAELIQLSWPVDDSGPPAFVDLADADGVPLPRQIQLDIYYAWPGEQQPTTEVVSTRDVAFEQFRVDYDLPTAEQPPFYANLSYAHVTQGQAETTPLILEPVGPDQIAWVADLYQGEPISGRATVTLAGNDHRGEVVLVEAPSFVISFADYTTEDEQP